MSAKPKIIAIGCVDELGIAGTQGVHADWETLGVKAPGNGRTYRELSGKKDDTFRRLNGTTRALVLAAEACGIDRMLPPEVREETALVVETAHGCLEVDLKFARALDMGIAHAAIFPYTLQSTCLGDVALRHGLRGPTLSLSIQPGEEGEALAEVERLFAAGEVRYAVAGIVDVFDETLHGAEPDLRAVVCLLAAPGEASEAVADWPARESEPFAVLAAACRAARA